LEITNLILNIPEALSLGELENIFLTLEKSDEPKIKGKINYYMLYNVFKI
jgi:hypothetical protein